MIGEGVSAREVAESMIAYLQATGGSTNREMIAALGWTQNQLDRGRRLARETGMANIVGPPSKTGEKVYRITDEDTDTADEAERYRKTWVTQLRIMLAQMESQKEKTGGLAGSFIQALAIVAHAYSVLEYQQTVQREVSDAQKKAEAEVRKMNTERRKALKEAAALRRQLAKATR